MKRVLHLSLVLSSLFVLSGCETWTDFKQSLSNTFSNVDTSFATDEPVLVEEELKCPDVRIVDELANLTEFSGDGPETTENLVSTVYLNKVESGCEFSQKNVTIDLKLEFAGNLGAKAKTQPSDKPFFAYPFFIAVLNANDEILAKEVFSASMSYSRAEERHTYYESLRQIIPFEDEAAARNYKVLVGFQLTQDQLAYNRRNLIPVAPVTEKAPTVKPDWE